MGKKKGFRKCKKVGKQILKKIRGGSKTIGGDRQKMEAQSKSKYGGVQEK